MKRVIWASILLVLAGIFMPLVFMGDGEAIKEREALPSEILETSPAPTSENPVTPSEEPLTPSEKPVGQAAEKRDEEIIFNLSDSGKVYETNMAEYLPYAIAAEMPVSFEAEALKAQAVAARTYAVYCTEHENPKHPDADVCTDAGCCLAYMDEKALRGSWGESFETNMAIARAAAKDTDGQVLTYENEPILASFHSSSAGMTEEGSELWGDVPYLAAVKSPETAEDVPNFVTTVEVTPENFKESIHLLYPDTAFGEDPSAWVGERELDESGRVRYIAISGATLSGSEMRKLFSLRSTAFTLEYNGAAFVFTVTGYGHGLGLSQYGANVMARGGSSYSEILLHYYPQTELG